jgi:hypothetical protein
MHRSKVKRSVSCKVCLCPVIGNVKLLHLNCTMTEAQVVKAKLMEALDLVAESLVAVGYPERVKDSYELIDMDEFAIALENICSNLDEFECSIPIKAYDLFAEAGVYLNVDSSYWEILKPLFGHTKPQVGLFSVQ